MGDGYNPQLKLTDEQVAQLRGLADRGLSSGLSRNERPPETLQSMYDARSKQIVGCSDNDQLNGLIADVEALEQLLPSGDVPNRPTIVFDRDTLRRLLVVGSAIAAFHNRTPCLFRLASLMDRSLSRQLFNRFPKEFFELLEVLTSIGDELIRRTKEPYKFFAATRMNPPLDPQLLKIEPLASYHYWKTLLDVRSNKAIISDPIPLEETHFSVEDEQGWELALEEIQKTVEAMEADTRIRAASVGDAPVIYGHLQNLRELKLADIEKQTRARFPAWWHDYSVYDHVGLVVYNSVYSVLLDTRGNPYRKPGIAPHAVLLPEPGEHLLRNFHPPGLYLSLGKLADYQFVVSGKKVKNLLLAGIVSFTRRENTFVFEHELQEKLQKHIEFMGIRATAAITVKEAFGTPGLSLSAVKRAIPGLITEVTRYALIELMARLERLVENPEQVIKEVGLQVIRGIIEKKIRDWCAEWLIKKIGKRFIPGLNVASAVADLLDDEEIEMIRALVACVVMVTKSKRRDDLTISAKITSKIAVDKVQEAVVQELVNRGAKRLSKPSKQADADQGAADPKAQPQDASTTNTSDQLRDAQQPDTAPKSDPKTQPQPPQRPQDQQLQQQQTKRPTPPEPVVDDKGTANKSVRDKGTKPADTSAPNQDAAARKGSGEPQTVELQPGVYRRRGRERQPGAQPPAESTAGQNVDHGQDIADTHRELTQRGHSDDRGTDPNVHPSQSRPESIEAARQAGVAPEVYGDGYVMTRADFPEAAPDRPVPRGKPAPPALATTRPVSRSDIQNTEVQADLELTLQALGPDARVVDIRVNQTQTATDGGRAGTNRPDVQLTIVQAEVDGKRIHIEYDRSPPTRAIEHARRILANDPEAIVILKIIDYEPPTPRS